MFGLWICNIEHAHPVPAQLGVVDHPPDVDGLAVVPDAEDEVPLVLKFIEYLASN